jgi:hypothetical protein
MVLVVDLGIVPVVDPENGSSGRPWGLSRWWTLKMVPLVDLEMVQVLNIGCIVTEGRNLGVADHTIDLCGGYEICAMGTISEYGKWFFETNTKTGITRDNDAFFWNFHCFTESCKITFQKNYATCN